MTEPPHLAAVRTSYDTAVAEHAAPVEDLAALKTPPPRDADRVRRSRPGDGSTWRHSAFRRSASASPEEGRAGPRRPSGFAVHRRRHAPHRTSVTTLTAAY
ncbi:hypothetical protein ABZ700_12265 [Streptomyces diastaticus]|uniref:hypothetical protein n=1 Tax=Streptomyces diastaticus TaxID=1956 RepID=UPI0033D89020